mmetsp:Transcript_101984/g.197436  ORF Transcript_101984/g.197436 Transcript_101984/m.197436 type:complete len:215 (+) Transcript_101984:46-690(+)
MPGLSQGQWEFFWGNHDVTGIDLVILVAPTTIDLFYLLLRGWLYQVQYRPQKLVTISETFARVRVPKPLEVVHSLCSGAAWLVMLVRRQPLGYGLALAFVCFGGAGLYCFPIPEDGKEAPLTVYVCHFFFAVWIFAGFLGTILFGHGLWSWPVPCFLLVTAMICIGMVCPHHRGIMREQVGIAAEWLLAIFCYVSLMLAPTRPTQHDALFLATA